jgi:hypothetical protein
MRSAAFCKSVLVVLTEIAAQTCFGAGNHEKHTSVALTGSVAWLSDNFIAFMRLSLENNYVWGESKTGAWRHSRLCMPTGHKTFFTGIGEHKVFSSWTDVESRCAAYVILMTRLAFLDPVDYRHLAKHVIRAPNKVMCLGRPTVFMPLESAVTWNVVSPEIANPLRVYLQPVSTGVPFHSLARLNIDSLNCFIFSSG